MDRFEYASPILEQDEVTIISVNNVRLYDGDNKTGYEGGEITLTSYRLWWSRPGDVSLGFTCLSLPLNYVVYIEEEIPGPFQFSRSTKVILHLSSALQDKKPGPVANSSHNFIKLSFKDELYSDLLSMLNNTVQQKKWELRNINPKPGSHQIKPRTGIVGIERGIQEKQIATDKSISVAFQDLSKLMDMAKDMVSLSKNISSKIRDKHGSITEDETVRFKSYLLSLGIDDPVTRDSYSSQSHYIKDLARQIVEILETPIREQGGVMSLVDAYCRVNRARGLELLSPDDLVRAANLLDELKLPVRFRKFDSGVYVLQLASHSDEAIAASTSQLVEEKGSMTGQDLAQILGISVQMAKHRLVITEMQSKVCRDESIQGLRFYPNLFLTKDS